jgi:hypothetical protein
LRRSPTVFLGDAIHSATRRCTHFSQRHIGLEPYGNYRLAIA